MFACPKIIKFIWNVEQERGREGVPIPIKNLTIQK